MFEAQHETDNVEQVDGGGVQAEVVETDVGASNGVIHSINRVSVFFLTCLAFPRGDLHIVLHIFLHQTLLDVLGVLTSVLEILELSPAALQGAPPRPGHPSLPQGPRPPGEDTSGLDWREDTKP